MNLKENIIRFILKKFFYRKFKFEVNYNDFDPKRKDPYFLIGNHPALHEGLYISIHLKRYPIPIINSFLFTNKGMKFVLTKLIYSIPKRKGQNDITTIREMMRIIKSGRGIMIFPEGNASYFGDQNPIPFSTAKLLKKMKLDVVTVRTNGAYLAAPRWGDKATKNGLVELDFRTLYKSEDIDKLSLEEIYDGLVEELKFNDFDWNREKKFLYKPKYRALGLERYIYFCPKCLSYQTISTKGNNIYCDYCGEIAHFNEYSFIEGLQFDNLVEWGELQKTQIPNIAKNTLYSSGKFYLADTVKFTTKFLGEATIKLEGQNLNILTKIINMNLNVNNMEDLVLTRKQELSFDYEGITYYIVIKDPMLFYDMINYKKGGHL